MLKLVVVHFCSDCSFMTNSHMCASFVGNTLRECVLKGVARCEILVLQMLYMRSFSSLDLLFLKLIVMIFSFLPFFLLFPFYLFLLSSPFVSVNLPLLVSPSFCTIASRCRSILNMKF